MFSGKTIKFSKGGCSTHRLLRRLRIPLLLNRNRFYNIDLSGLLAMNQVISYLYPNNPQWHRLSKLPKAKKQKKKKNNYRKFLMKKKQKRKNKHQKLL